MQGQGWMKAVLLYCFLGLSTTTLACTGIALKSKDGSHINGRTIEFGMPLDLNFIIIPHNYAFQGSLPDETGGLIFRAKYAAMGSAAFGESNILDGINEKGLSVAAFYFPGYASYAPVSPGNKMKAVSPTEFSNWLLTQFTSVDEIKGALNQVVIVPTTPKGWPGLPPLHYIVYDQSGKSIVIEPIKGKLKIYNNPLGVLTNSPTFGWQMTNLSSYINLSPINPGPTNIQMTTLESFGRSTGLHGLPGNFSSPARFVRAAILSTLISPTQNANDTVLQTFHLLNQFDIPVGAAGNKEKNNPEYTIATTVKDTKNLKYYFKTYDDQTIKMVDFSKLDKESKTLKTIPMTGKTVITDITANAQ